MIVYRLQEKFTNMNIVWRVVIGIEGKKSILSYEKWVSVL